MLTITAVNESFEFCSKLTFVPHQKNGAFLILNTTFLNFSLKNRSKSLIFAHFKPIFAHFLVRQTMVSTWVKTPKGIFWGEKRGISPKSLAFNQNSNDIGFNSVVNALDFGFMMTFLLLNPIAPQKFKSEATDRSLFSNSFPSASYTHRNG